MNNSIIFFFVVVPITFIKNLYDTTLNSKESSSTEKKLHLWEDYNINNYRTYIHNYSLLELISVNYNSSVT